MNKEQYNKLKSQAEEECKKAILLAQKQRSERLKAIETIWLMLKQSIPEFPEKPVSNITVDPIIGQVPEKKYGALTIKTKRLLNQNLVPEIFTQNEIMVATGCDKAGSMAGCLMRLIKQGVIEKVEQGKGRTPSKYRRKNAESIFEKG